MKRPGNILTLVLALQLLLVVGFFQPRGNEGDNAANQALLAIDSDSISRLDISGSANSIALALDDGEWVMPQYHGLPVDNSRLERVLRELPALLRGWPIAQSSPAAQRFEVAADNFQRQIEYFAGETRQGAILLGTSPGFRKVHVRNADSDAIYAVAFNSFDAPAQAAGWMDKTLLQVSDLRFIDGLDYQLSLEGENWVGEAGAAPAQTEVDTLLNALNSLRVTAVADIATAAILEEMRAPPTLTVTAGEETYEYRLFEIEDARYIRRADIPVFFSLSSLDYDRLNKVNAAGLFPSRDNHAEVPGKTADTGEPPQT